MPVFHFEIVDGYIVEDPRGMELKTEAQAIVMAEQIAHQIAKDLGPSSLKSVVVRTDCGEQIYKAMIRKVREAD